MNQSNNHANQLSNSQLIWGKDIRLIVKAILLLALCGVLSWKIIQFDTSKIVVDFATLISVLLALFSIALAVAFYHMANVSSQKFYADTFSFTKGIAESLAKIDSGFGEKLHNLYQNYENFRVDYAKINERENKNKDEVEQTSNEIEKLIQEKEAIIEELLLKSQMDKEQKAQIHKKYLDNQELLQKLERQLEVRNKIPHYLTEMIIPEPEMPAGFDNYMRSHVFPMFGVDRNSFLNLRFSEVRNIFKENIRPNLPSGVIDDLISLNFFDGIRLTNKGATYFRSIARESSNVHQENS